MDRISSLRIEYEQEGLSRSEMATDPYSEFLIWYEEADAAGVHQVNAFVLSTADVEGRPSARAVLAKAVDEEGIIFYTNRLSRKGRELADNPHAAATFLWLDLHRQIRVEGEVTPVADTVADEYFSSRPPGARLGAAASPQSSVVPDRATLDQEFAELEMRYPDGDVPRPDHWGGYRISWGVAEFWQGRPNRFHDRIRYRKKDDAWIKERLAP